MLKIRNISLVFLSLLSCTEMYSGGRIHVRELPRITFGIEGGVSNLFMTYRKFNFISTYGYRVHDMSVTSGYHLNGELLVHAGCNISGKLNLSLYTGYSGISKLMYMHPLTLRLTCYPGPVKNSGQWFVFADGGPGFRNIASRKDISYVGKLGGGYRIVLSRSVRLDFLASFRTVFTEPFLSERGNASISVSRDKIRRNDALYTSLNVGIGITF